ncbi:hypothetical protein ACFL2R_00295, partial [Patescibacteria group bacterium]
GFQINTFTDISNSSLTQKLINSNNGDFSMKLCNLQAGQTFTIKGNSENIFQKSRIPGASEYTKVLVLDKSLRYIRHSKIHRNTSVALLLLFFIFFKFNYSFISSTSLSFGFFPWSFPKK